MVSGLSFLDGIGEEIRRNRELQWEKGYVGEVDVEMREQVCNTSCILRVHVSSMMF
jgi:hypothetical protein